MNRTCISIGLMGSIVLAGCHVSTSERVLMRYLPPAHPSICKAPYKGDYRLYAGGHRHDLPAGNPIAQYRLHKGDAIGFATDSQGQIVSVALSERRPLPDGRNGFTWTMQPDPGQFDAAKTVALVVGICLVVGVGAAVGISAAAPSALVW